MCFSCVLLAFSGVYRLTPSRSSPLLPFLPTWSPTSLIPTSSQFTHLSIQTLRCPSISLLSCLPTNWKLPIYTYTHLVIRASIYTNSSPSTCTPSFTPSLIPILPTSVSYYSDYFSSFHSVPRTFHPFPSSPSIPARPALTKPQISFVFPSAEVARLRAARQPQPAATVDPL